MSLQVGADASGAWKKKTRLGFGLGHGGSVRPSPNHGLSTDRPTFSHERHVDLEKTLLNDDAATPMDSEEQPKDLDQDLDLDDEDAMFNWDSEQSLLYDLMDEGYESFFFDLMLYSHRSSGFSTSLSPI